MTKTKPSKIRTAAVAAMLAATGTAVHADLAQVGPVDPAVGFPQWYQDNNGLALDLCLPSGATPPAGQLSACLLAGIGINPPYVFPTNFPSEVFFHRVVGNIPMPLGKKAVLVLTLESSFAPAGVPAPGTQVVFSRIRVTAGVPVAGTYTVTHPYGVEVFPDVQPGVGNRDIHFTENVGNLSPGAFSLALKSRLGPFLRAADALGNPLPPVEVPVGSGQFFLSNALTPTAVTGSPFGTNYFEICGPAGSDLGGAGNPCVRQTLFQLQGKVHQGAIGSPLRVDRATYARDGTSSHVDVLANVKAAPLQAAPVLSMGDVHLPPVLMAGPNVLGEYFGQGIPGAPTPDGRVPATVTVTNSGDVPPTSVTQNLIDQVQVSQATFDPTAKTLTVMATSSDKGNLAAGIPVPALALSGFPAGPALTVTRPSPGTPTDPASVEFVVSGVTETPSSVTVQSAAGGRETETVAILPALAFPAGAPFAADDNVGATAGAAVTIPVLANDVGVPTGAAVKIVGQGANGVATVNLDNTVTYTPSNPAFVGADSFTYDITSALPTSNVATVNLTVAAPAGGVPPIAVADGPINAQTGIPVTINVLANDLANGGVINPASVKISTLPAAPATVSVNPTTGAVTFNSPITGTFTFAYTVANAAGQISAPATVTVNVTPPEILTVSTAKCVRGTTTRWVIKGTSSISTNNGVTVYVGATVPASPTAAQVLGTVPVLAGAWALDVKVSSPTCSSPVSIQSSLGNMVVGAPVAIQ